MVGTSHHLHTHTRSTSCIKKVFDILYMWWAVKWLRPYSTVITIALAKFGGGGECVDFWHVSYSCYVMIGSSHPLILIPDLLYTYIKRLTYFIWSGQSYECVLTPLSSQYNKQEWLRWGGSVWCEFEWRILMKWKCKIATWTKRSQNARKMNNTTYKQ